jgi:2,3,4,5-tetrahydropyridine-2-carboxylate N-succinyltransferase
MTNNTSYPQTTAEFLEVVAKIQDRPSYRKPILFALGSHVKTANGTLASVRYPFVNGPGQNAGSAAILINVLGIETEGVKNVMITPEQLAEVRKYFYPFRADGKKHLNLDVFDMVLAKMNGGRPLDDNYGFVVSFIFDDIEPQGVEDSTLKLYAFSNRIFKPNQINVTKIFTKLPNVAWIGDKPMDSDSVDQALMVTAFGHGQGFAPHMVDKFPLYIHRINAIKMGVRITDQHKVRLGAYLGEGTTIMPGASYVNFNAGTEGPCMNEGRISSSAWVGAGSDIGGGASILGTLSGGNEVPITVGRNCLLEVNCALGIPVGDAVIIGAETAVMASSRIRVGIEGHPLQGQTVKASELAGINAATFRRNDDDGVLEVVRTRRNEKFARKLEDGESILSADLHKND